MTLAGNVDRIKEMEKLGILPLALLVLATGCAIPKYNYQPAAIDISEPSIDSVTTAYVGDSLLHQENYMEYDAIYVPFDVEIGVGIPHAPYAFLVRKGFYLKEGEDEDVALYVPSKTEDGGEIIDVVPLHRFLDPPKGVLAYETKYELCVVKEFLQIKTWCKSGATYSETKKSLTGTDSFQQTLIYSGKLGSKIDIGYREVSNDLTRSVFNKRLEHDLTESTIIDYRGARIEVIEATDEFIKYRVMRNFKKSAM